MKQVLALLALVLVAQATTTGFESIFAQTQAPMGQAIQSLVQMNMQESEGQLQEIADLLYEIQAIIDSQQKAADESIEKSRQQCEADLALYNKQLTSATESLADSQSEQSELEAEQIAKNQQLGNEQTNYESTSEDLVSAQDQLSEEDTSFTEFKVEFDDAIAACEEAIRLLTQLANGNASSFIQKNKSSGIMFVQLSQRFSDVKDLLENHVKRGGPAAFVQPIIDVLAELGTQNKVDAGKVTQIIELIQTLLTRLREGLYERTQQNVTSKADLNSLVSTLQSAVNSSGNTIQILETRISEIETRLTELAALIVIQGDVVVAKQKLIANTEADCDADEQVYTTETTQRTSNLALLDKLIEHFESQVVGAVGGVRDGVVE